MCELIDTFADMKAGKYQKRVVSESPENRALLSGRGVVVEREDLIKVRPSPALDPFLGPLLSLTPTSLFSLRSIAVPSVRQGPDRVAERRRACEGAEL